MNVNSSHSLQQEINTSSNTLLFHEMMKTLAEQAANYHELLALWQEMHYVYMETVSTYLQQWAEKYNALDPTQKTVQDKIEADAVVIEIVDKNTGKMFIRNLPIQYLETDNGIILSGETISGGPAEIAFYSEAALTRMKDILGKGPDSHRCPE